MSVTELFPVNAVGFQTHRDYLVICPSKEELLQRITEFVNPANSDEEVRRTFFAHTTNTKYALGDNRDWKVPAARRELQKVKHLEQWITTCVRAPFDFQYYSYHPAAVDYGRPAIMNSLIGHDNRALLWTRPMSPKYDFSVFCAACTVDQSVVGNKVAGAGGTYVGPLYLYAGSAAQQNVAQGTFGGEFNKKKVNLHPEFTAELATLLGINYVEEGAGDLCTTFGPEDVFDYAYAVFHAPSFRERFVEFLKTDVPRVPFTRDKALFAALVKKGQALAALHAMKSKHLDNFITDFPETGTNEIGKVTYVADEGRVWINPTQYFGGVPADVWRFEIGGYVVCEKWLKDRKGRKLTYDDVQHWQRMIVAIRETMHLIGEIDALIPGWPLP